MDIQDTQILDNHSASSDCETDDGGGRDDEIPVLYGDTQPLDDPDDVEEATVIVDSGGEKTEVLDDDDCDVLGDDGDSRSCGVGGRSNGNSTNVVEAENDGLVGPVASTDKEVDAVEADVPAFVENGEYKTHEGVHAAGESDSADIGLTQWENNRKESTPGSIDLVDEMECKDQIANLQWTTMNSYNERAKSRSTCSSAKKVISDGLCCEKDESVNEAVTGVEEACSEQPGSNYLASQEPGEQSQVHALEVIDNFLLVNEVGLSQDANNIKNEVGKFAVKLAAKGALSLAQKSNCRSPVGKAGIFDWDDALEDERGGEFFFKTKDFFFNSTCDQPKTQSCPPKARQHMSRRNSSASCEKKRNATVNSKTITEPVGSHTPLVTKNSCRTGTVQRSHKRTKKNLFKDIGEEPKLESSVHHVADNVTEYAEGNVGPDTQIAAEAMEALIKGLQEHGQLSAGTSIENPNKKLFTKGLSNDFSLFKRNSVDDSEGVTTRSKKRKMFLSKQKMPAVSLPADDEQSLGLDKSSESTLKEKSTMGKRKLATQMDARSPVSRNTRSKSLKIEKTQGIMSETYFCNDEEHNEPPVSKLQILASEDPPVAHRTRHSKRVNLEEDAADHRKQENSRKINSGIKNMNTICNEPSVSSNSMIKTELLPEQGRRIYVRSVSDILDEVKGKKQSPLSNMELKSKRMPSNTKKVAGKRAGSSLISHSSDQDMVCAATPKSSVKCRNAETSELSAGCIGNAEEEKFQTPIPVCKTPLQEVNVVSPVYSAPNTPKSFRKGAGRSSISRELLRLEADAPSIRTLKDVRRRKDMTSIRVLFSRHLGEDTTKQQKKILTRLGLQAASSISNATHFVTDKFVRTQNMLEAIAAGKLVVTPLWIETCGQASCIIDAKKYILRDLKKEKEMGFNMTVSLARACQNPLLQGKKVLITPTVKPSRDLIVSLVKASCGQALERVGRSVTKQGQVPDDLLVISCEEDYTICRPFLEEGAGVFSPELLLSGIIIQKLEYERHRLFLDHVKQNRSRMCLRRKQGG